MKKTFLFLLPIFFALFFAPFARAVVGMPCGSNSEGVCANSSDCTYENTLSDTTTCGSTEVCCKKSSSSETCTGKGYTCISSDTTCSNPKDDLKSSCGTDKKCCADDTCTGKGYTCISADDTTCSNLKDDLKSSCGNDEKCCADDNGSGGGETSGIDGIDLPSNSETGLTDRPILEIISTILGWLLKIFLLLATIAFVITGLQFLFALGSSYSDAATNAKKNFVYSIIALVVVGAGYIIILTIDLLLKG